MRLLFFPTAALEAPWGRPGGRPGGAEHRKNPPRPARGRRSPIHRLPRRSRTSRRAARDPGELPLAPTYVCGQRRRAVASPWNLEVIRG